MAQSHTRLFKHTSIPVRVGSFAQQKELAGGNLWHAEQYIVHFGFLVIPPVGQAGEVINK